ncbi:ABC transporter substrate-binding protein [Ruminococcaceae bacterium BL-6]|nr:ABC transporter substrate-binding protein [Ruminococcaceae bacterium BL-6]
MKKMLSVLLAGALAMSTLAGCGGGGTASTSSAAAPQGTASGEKTTIVLWTRDRHDASFIQPRVDEYNKTNKDGIFVDYQMYTDNFEQALDMAYSTNSGPDLVGVSGMTDIFTKYVNQGQYVSIDQYMTAEQKERYKSLVSEGIDAMDGKLYYIPVFGSTGRLFYNEGIFEKCGIQGPPKTMAEMTKTAKTITDKLKGEGVYGFAMNLKSPSSALQRSIDFIVERSGGPKQGYDFATGKYDFSMYKEAVKEFNTIFTTGIAFPGCESLDIDPLRTQFAAGKIGMYISWSHADPGVYQSQFPTKEKWNVAQLPTIDGKVYSQSIQPYKGYMITKTCKAPEKAWKVCNDVFYSDDFVKAYHEAGLSSVMVDDLKDKVKAPEILKGKENGLLGDTDKFWPATPQELNSQAVVVEGNDQYTALAAMILGSEPIDSGLKALTDRYNAALQKGIKEGKGKEIKIANWDPANPNG